MIKKILYILGFMMMASAMFTPLLALGEDEQFSKEPPFNTSRMFSKILPDFASDNWFESSGDIDPEDVGKDLYFKVLQSLVVDPSEKAMENTAGRYGLSQTDTSLIMSGNYQPIFDKKPTMTQEQLISTLNKMQSQYNTEFDKLTMQAEIEAQTKPSEIFANGDLDDSGFDLIYDLDRIEELLFLRSSPHFIGAAYNKKSDGGAGGGAGGGTTPEPVVPVPGGTPLLPGGLGSGGGSGGTGGEPGSGSTSTVESSEHDGLNPSECLEDSDLKNAIDDYDAKNGGSSANDANGTDDDTEADENAGDEGQSESAIDLSDEILPEISKPEKPPTEPAPADDWSRDKICFETFCLDVNVEYKQPNSSFQDQDNCIACHVEKINDTLKSVISHSLTPSKISGNPLEAPKCKSGLSLSLSAVSMNVNVQFMPINTPLNDELIFNSDLAEDWKYFCDATAFFPAEMCEVEPDPAVIIESPPSLEERVLLRELSMMPEGTTFSTLQTNVNNGQAAVAAPAAANAKEITTERSQNATIALYRALLVELDQMNFYFNNFRDIFRSLHENVPGIPGTAACTVLKNKKTCS